MNQHHIEKQLSRLGVLLLAVALTISLISSVTVFASASFTVNSTTDAIDANLGDGICATSDGFCTLRAAIQESNVLSSNDTIILPAGTYTLTIGGVLEDEGAFGDLDITDDLTLTGEGAESTIIDGNALDRVLHLVNENVTVEINGVTIRNGRIPYLDVGGGIYNNGELDVSESVISGNSADEGGGIYNNGELDVSESVISGNEKKGIYNGGQVMLSDTIISDNNGGGIRSRGTLTLNNITVIYNNGIGIDLTIFKEYNITINNSLISHNNGAGIFYFFGLNHTLTLNESTISDNTGHGIYNYTDIGTGTTTLNNSTVSGNGASGIYNDYFYNFLGREIYNDDSFRYARGGFTLFLNQSTVSHNNNAGIYHDRDTMVIQDSTIRDNNNSGIYNGGQLTVNNSTISGNSTDENGGGIDNHGRLTVNNSTISGNSASQSGGGIYTGSDASTILNLNNVTLTDNTADSDQDGSGNGGGLANYIGEVNLQNTIIAGNHDQNPTTQVADCSSLSVVNSLGYNILPKDATNCPIGGDRESNLYGVEPNLGPLQDNGGSTFTHALLLNSPAIDAGNPADCTDEMGTPFIIDQIGSPRSMDGDENGTATCDMGAYELPSINIPTPTIPLTPASTTPTSTPTGTPPTSTLTPTITHTPSSSSTATPSIEQIELYLPIILRN